MTVKELRELLTQFDDDMEVIARNEEITDININEDYCTYNNTVVEIW